MPQGLEGTDFPVQDDMDVGVLMVDSFNGDDLGGQGVQGLEDDAIGSVADFLQDFVALHGLKL